MLSCYGRLGRCAPFSGLVQADVRPPVPNPRMERILRSPWEIARVIPLPLGRGNICNLELARACACGRSRLVRVRARAVGRACASVRAPAGARTRARFLARVRARVLARMDAHADVISSGRMPELLIR